ncbi:uncharacterized protein LOC128035345 [Gossypium raimondii]|uniref:uncharacterized protein LOC128035345 n=1 Tax=Gossypium raimondii TaxID=29730 RepID=UPI00227C020A|nr:uncharacterized protein LOC128035345 [Gossypium raimondii]
MDFTLEKLAKLYIGEIVRLHRVLTLIILDRDLHFTLRVWRTLHEALGTRIHFSITFHLQTDELNERKIVGPKLVWETEDKKSYSDLKHKEIKFAVGNKFFLKVSHWKKVLRFRCKGKLSLRFIGPYEVLERVGPVAYRLALPLKLERIHNMFHVSMLRRYHFDPSHILPLEQVEVTLDLSYEEEFISILARDIKELRNKKIPLVKVLWRNHGVEETTWEPEESMKLQYLHLFYSVEEGRESSKANGKGKVVES